MQAKEQLYRRDDAAKLFPFAKMNRRAAAGLFEKDPWLCAYKSLAARIVRAENREWGGGNQRIETKNKNEGKK